MEHLYDDIAFDIDDEEISTEAEDDLPPGFSAFHQRFPGIVSPHFGEDNAEDDVAPAPPNDANLGQRIDQYLDNLLQPRH